MSKESLELLSIILTAIITLLGWKVYRRTEELKIMRSQLSERKHKAYADIVTTFYSILKDTANKKATDMDKIKMKMIDSKRDVFMYGSDEVFKAFNHWLINAKSPIQFKAYLQFILAIRRDICGKTTLTEDDILLNLMQDESELQKFKEQNQLI